MSHAEPPADTPAWGSDWTVGLRVWVEREGRAVLGKGRLELLEAIDRWHSISAAARQLGMSYRRAWLLVQSINEAAGQQLVVAATGGLRGGGAQLNEQGRRAAAVFRELLAQLHQSAGATLGRLVQGPGSAAVHVAAAVSLEEVLGQLLADYALRRPDVRVRTVFGASDELADHLLAGAPADLFLTADPTQLDRLAASGLVDAGTGVPLADNSLAAVAPAEGTAPVRRPADLLKPGVARVAFAEPASPLGGYTRSYLKDLGLYELLLPRALTVDNSRAVLAAVRAGRADVGLVYTSDAVRADGCRLLFRARAGTVVVRYTAAILSKARQPGPAADLFTFLTSRRAVQRFRRCGFIPVRRP